MSRERGFYTAIMDGCLVTFFVNKKGDISVVRISPSNKPSILLATESYSVYDSIYIPIIEWIDAFKKLSKNTYIYSPDYIIFDKKYKTLDNKVVSSSWCLKYDEDKDVPILVDEQK